MFERFIELIYNIVNGFRDNILPLFDFLLEEFSFVNPITDELVAFSMFEMLFGSGLLILFTYRIVLSLIPILE